MPNFFQEGYEIPSTSNYMKLEEGENRFRILGSFAEGKAITGMEYWVTKDGKRVPKRLRPGIPVPVAELEINPETGETEMPRHFWALPVYNYDAKRVHILEITQKTIQQQIMNFVNNAKWGDPTAYDIVVTKTKENGKTSYSVMPEPKEPLSDEIKKAQQATPINIEALYDGGDPFMVQDKAPSFEEIPSVETPVTSQSVANDIPF